MFFLTLEEQASFDAAQSLYYEDGDYHDDALGDAIEHLSFIPKKFHEAIHNKSLFRNKILHKECIAWCEDVINRYFAERNATYDKQQQFIDQLHPSSQKIFAQSLHDGEIVSYRKEHDEVKLLLNMSGGFTVEAVIELTFHNAMTEGTLEGYYIYDELVETDTGFALRVLSSFGSPYEQWTIYFENVSAKYVYRPALAVEPGEIDTIEQFVEALSVDQYFVLHRKEIVSIDIKRIYETKDGIFAHNLLLGGNFDEVRERIFCATYKDPYAHFSEPLPVDELHDAIFGDDQTLRVRAFNTIFALGEEVAALVNDILRKAVHDEDEMFFSVLASHFNKFGCLDTDVKKKWI